jgi:lysophospholipase L1-like esterase
METRSLTAVFGCTLLCFQAHAQSTSRDFEFATGGNAAGNPIYDGARGFGFEPGVPGRFSVRVPEGNHRVTLKLESSTERPPVRVFAEQRRLMLMESIEPDVERSFIVNVRTAALPPLPANATGGTGVALKTREIDSPTWDDKLTIAVGTSRMASLRVAPADVPTLYLAGDSTVTDQAAAPAASWGQMLPLHFAPSIAVANHAESGETLKSFVTELRLDKLLSRLESGDWVMIQFGHNDQKTQWPQTYAEASTTYRAWLRTYIAEVRRRGATPLLVTPPERRHFDAAGHIVPSLGEYPDAIRAVAREERVALIDLTPLSVRFYEKLGPNDAPRAFADDGRDLTHHSEFGAAALAGFVIDSLRAADGALTAGLETHLRSNSIVERSERGK